MEYFAADNMDEINSYMKKIAIDKREVILIKGEMISGLDNSHWPRDKKQKKKNWNKYILDRL